MRCRFFQWRVPSFSFGVMVLNLARGYYRRYYNTFSMNVRETASVMYDILPFKQATCHRTVSHVNIFHKAAVALFISSGYAWAHNFTRTQAACQGFTMENIEEESFNTESIKPLEMNEIAALSHTSLLRQASGVAVDAALQLLHRSLRATLDFSAQYRKKLNEAIDLLEFCTATMHNPEQHDTMWELLVAARSHTDSLKQQLKDLSILISYAYVMVENAGMTAYMSGVEFTASTAQQAVTNAKCELDNETRQNQALEVQYMYAHTRYIVASQRLTEEREQLNRADEDDKTQEQEKQGASTC